MTICRKGKWSRKGGRDYLRGGGNGHGEASVTILGGGGAGNGHGGGGVTILGPAHDHCCHTPCEPWAGWRDRLGGAP